MVRIGLSIVGGIAIYSRKVNGFDNFELFMDRQKGILISNGQFSRDSITRQFDVSTEFWRSVL